MISANRLQIAYNNLYKYIRNYIWGYDVIEALANLEVATYKAFPDLKDIKKYLQNLKSQLKYTDIFEDDEDLEESFNDFEDLLESSDEVYALLNQVQEVIPRNDYKEKKKHFIN